MTIVQQASGTFNGTTLTATLPGASSASNQVVLIIAGNTIISTNPATGGTVSGWAVRRAEINQMGHYLLDRAGSTNTYSLTMSSGQGTWWIAEIAGGTYDTSTSANNATGSGIYNTPNLTPAVGTKIVIASIGSTLTGTVRTISGWTNSFIEQADVCQPVSDYPMQGVAVLDNLAANGSTAQSTAITYSATSSGRSAIIASYATSAGGGDNTGTVSGALPEVTGSIAGASVDAGDTAGTLPEVTGSIAGAAVNTGTLSASLPAVTGSVAGQSVNAATTSSALPKVTGSITGTATNTGATAGTFPVVVTGSITGAAANAGTVAGTLPKMTGAIADQAINVGTIAGTLPVVTGSIPGTNTTNTGTVSGSLPKVTGAVAGAATNAGTLVANLPPVRGSITDTTTVIGTLTATLAPVTGSISGQSVNAGILAATLAKVTGSVPGISVDDGLLVGTLPRLTGSVAGTAVNVGSVAGTFPNLTGRVSDRELRDITATARAIRVRAAVAIRNRSAEPTRAWKAASKS